MTTESASDYRQYLPNYRKRKVFVSYVDRVQLMGRYWDGGSRSSYVLFDADGNAKSFPASQDFPAFNSSREYYELQQGEVVVKFGTFRGKTATAHIYIRKG